jgi:glycogen operon protein
MSEENWNTGFAKSLGVFLNGEAIPTPSTRGERVVDASFYVFFNAHSEPLTFTAPAADWGSQWITALDTRDAAPPDEDGRGEPIPARGTFNAEAWSVVVLRRIA